MITIEKLKVYAHFGGDVDGWQRMSRLGDSDQMTGRDWAEIDELLRSLTIVQSGLASVEFVAETNARMADSAENEQVCVELREMASRP